jgi:hypothetical protein
LSEASRQTFIWHDLRIEAPAEWEMLQFSRDGEKGRLGWADRYQFRLELSYQRVTGAPYMERMLSDYRARLEEQGAEKLKAIREGSWEGFSAHVDQVFSTRFTRYIDPLRYLVEIVFLWPEARDRALEKEILATVRPHRWHDDAGEPNTPRRWRAFGLDFQLASEWPLMETSVEPALARLCFAPDKGSRQEKRFERHGMVEIWMKDSLDQWLRAQLPEKARVTGGDTVHLGGHTVVTLEGTLARESMIARLQTPHRLQAAAWHCPEDGRLYHIRSIAQPAADQAEEDSLQCCPQLAYAL